MAPAKNSFSALGQFPNFSFLLEAREKDKREHGNEFEREHEHHNITMNKQKSC